MKRAQSKNQSSSAAANERRKLVRATLLGSAFVSPQAGSQALTAVLDNVNRVGAGLPAQGKFVRATLVGSALVSPKAGAKAITAVLDNVNRVGAGLHAKDKLVNGEKVTVSLAFLDSDRVEQQERLDGTVAWVKTWEKGYLI